jgi:ATP-dependent protease ClpP protease subunit
MTVEIHAAAEAATLTLMGDVGYEITPVAVAAALKAAGGKRLTINLHSYGGSAFDGIAVHNMLARYPGQKTVVVEGVAASAASLIAMAGDRIVMPNNAYLMIHEAWGLAMGGAEAMRDSAALLDQVSASYRRTYAARSGKPEDEIAALMAAETWFTAEDAVAAGFATEAAEPIEIKACAAGLDRFKRVPQALLASARPATPSTTPPAPPALHQEVRVTEATPIDTAPPPAAPQPPPILATVEQIEAIAAKVGLPAEFALAQLRARVTPEQLSAAVIDAVAARQAPPIAARGAVQVLRDEGDTARDAVRAAIDFKFDAKAKLPEFAQQYRGARWMDLARASVEQAGGRTLGASPSDIARAALNLPGHQIKAMGTTSDFPGLLANNLSKRLLAAYDNAAEARAFLRFSFVRRLPDFKTARTVEIGMAPALTLVPEGATVTMGVIGEASETYTLGTYSRRQVLSYQALINDDLGAFDRLPQAWANAAANLEASIVWGLFNTNPNLASGNAWFSAANANTAAGTMIVDSIGAARAGIRAQTDASGQRLLVTPNVLIVPPALETGARALLAPQVVPATVATTAVNPWVGAFGEPVVGHFLTDTNDYYVAVGAGSGFEPVEVAYLEGQEAPMVESFTDPAILGVTTRCTHNFAAAPVTFRTIYRITA